MNKIILKGMIRNIEHSHNVKEIEYQKAELIVPRTDGEDDVLDLKFKDMQINTLKARLCGYREMFVPIHRS